MKVKSFLQKATKHEPNSGELTLVDKGHTMKHIT